VHPRRIEENIIKDVTSVFNYDGSLLGLVRQALENDDKIVSIYCCIFTNVKPYTTGGKNGLEPRLRQLFG